MATRKEPINDAAIRRLAKLRSCARPTAKTEDKEGNRVRSAVEAVREHVRQDAQDLVRDAATYAEHARRQTPTLEDLNLALERRGKHLYGFIDKETAVICKLAKQIKDARRASGSGGANCLYIASAPFRRLVRETSDQLKGDAQGPNSSTICSTMSNSTPWRCWPPP